MYLYDDIKLMYDWGLFILEQVVEFVFSCIIEDEFIKMIGELFSKSQVVFLLEGWR